MEFIQQFVSLFSSHNELFVTFLVCLLTIVKLTAWGRAQAAALDTVIGIIERVGAVDVKLGVAESESALSATTKDAIKDSVAKVDPKKTPKSLIYRIIREIFREPVSGL